MPELHKILCALIGIIWYYLIKKIYLISGKSYFRIIRSQD
jgi:hypothetical protein